MLAISLTSSSTLRYLLAGTFVTARILIQIQLMIRFGIPPLAGWYDLGSDLTILPPLLLHLLCDLLRYPLLLIIVEEDGATVLSAGIRTLPVQSGRVVHFVEEFEELTIGYLFGVKDDLERFGIYGILKLVNHPW